MNKEVKEHIDNLIKNFNEMNYEAQQEELFDLYKTGEVDYVDVVDKYSKLVKKIIKIKDYCKNHMYTYGIKNNAEQRDEILRILEED